MERYFTAGEACKISGVVYGNANYWARSGFLEPSIKKAKGSGIVRKYSLSDVVAMRVLAEMRMLGMDLSNLKPIPDVVRDFCKSDQAGKTIFLTYRDHEWALQPQGEVKPDAGPTRWIERQKRVLPMIVLNLSKTLKAVEQAIEKHDQTKR